MSNIREFSEIRFRDDVKVGTEHTKSLNPERHGVRITNDGGPLVQIEHLKTGAIAFVPWANVVFAHVPTPPKKPEVKPEVKK